MSAGNESVTQYPITDAISVMAARRGGLESAQNIGFSQADATKIAVVISELGRNIVNYAGEGMVTIIANQDVMGQIYIKIIAEDNGPGIANLEMALAGGKSTSGGLGLGLSGSKRMMDEFAIETAVGQGTIVSATKWL
jgi:serine/threonine-protein kinase RsbT